MKTPNKKLINLVDIVKNDFKDTIEDSQEKTLDNAASNKDDKSLTLDELAAKELMNGNSFSVLQYSKLPVQREFLQRAKNNTFIFFYITRFSYSA